MTKRHYRTMHYPYKELIPRFIRRISCVLNLMFTLYNVKLYVVYNIFRSSVNGLAIKLNSTLLSSTHEWNDEHNAFGSTPMCVVRIKLGVTYTSAYSIRKNISLQHPTVWWLLSKRFKQLQTVLVGQHLNFEHFWNWLRRLLQHALQLQKLGVNLDNTR